MNSLTPPRGGSEECDVEALHQLRPSTGIRDELQRILTSVQFDASDRNRRFLAYVVEETLAGRGERIKAYNIATTVFGRDDSFDAQLDPVVRMEARRLRRSLERFYLVEGERNAVRITMPKGGYVPKLLHSDAAQRATTSNSTHLAATTVSSLSAISILVSPFEVEDDSRTYKNHGEALARQVAVGLSHFPEIGVFTPQPSLGRNSSEHLAPSPQARELGFALVGSATLGEKVFRLTATLASERTGRVVWGETFEQATADQGILQARDTIASRMVRALAGSFDRIFVENRKVLDPKELPSCASFESLVNFNHYRRCNAKDLFQLARNSLEDVVHIESHDPETTACLSHVYSDGHRFGLAAEPPTELQARASRLARRSVELSPSSSRGNHALGISLWFSGDPDSSLETLRRAVALNPNSVDAIADLGLLLCLRGEWLEGMALINDADDGNSSGSGLQRLGVSLYQFANGHFEQALAEARRVRTLHATYGFAAQAISLIRLGRKEEASAAIARIREVRRGDDRDVLLELGGSSIESELASKIRLALHDAGLGAATA